MRFFTKEMIIVSMMALVVVSATSLLLADKHILPDSQWYFLKSSGEWIRVNFFTVSAIEKQDKHLEYASRRLEEAIELKRKNPGNDCSYVSLRYEKELARAEYMAEQLALLDPGLRYLVADVYTESLSHLVALRIVELRGLDGLVVSAQLYNSRSIKTLLHKYQFTEQDSILYSELVRQYIDYKSGLEGYEHNEKLKQAKEILEGGVEIEWAYDVAVSA